MDTGEDEDEDDADDEENRASVTRILDATKESTKSMREIWEVVRDNFTPSAALTACAEAVLRDTEVARVKLSAATAAGGGGGGGGAVAGVMERPEQQQQQQQQQDPKPEPGKPSREDSQDEGGSVVDDAFLKQWQDLLVGDKYGRASVKLAIVKPLFKPADDDTKEAEAELRELLKCYLAQIFEVLIVIRRQRLAVDEFKAADAKHKAATSSSDAAKADGDRSRALQRLKELDMCRILKTDPWNAGHHCQQMLIWFEVHPSALRNPIPLHTEIFHERPASVHAKRQHTGRMSSFLDCVGPTRTTLGQGAHVGRTWGVGQLHHAHRAPTTLAEAHGLRVAKQMICWQGRH